MVDFKSVLLGAIGAVAIGTLVFALTLQREIRGMRAVFSSTRAEMQLVKADLADVRRVAGLPEHARGEWWIPARPSEK